MDARTAGASDNRASQDLASDASVADVVLLAEVKASPGAAAEDLPRLLRGLQALAAADADVACAFGRASGACSVRIAGASLRRLRPEGPGLPPAVIYACAGDPEASPRWLGAAAKGRLLADPASLAQAGRLLQGGTPDPDELLPLWQALQEAARWRPVLHQIEAARHAREAMLHPEDLERAVDGALARRRAG